MSFNAWIARKVRRAMPGATRNARALERIRVRARYIETGRALAGIGDVARRRWTAAERRAMALLLAGAEGPIDGATMASLQRKRAIRNRAPWGYYIALPFYRHTPGRPYGEYPSDF